MTSTSYLNFHDFYRLEKRNCFVFVMIHVYAGVLMNISSLLYPPSLQPQLQEVPLMRGTISLRAFK